MELDVICPVLLILAISLSWNRFACIFSSEASAAPTAAALTTLATAVSLSALGFAFAGNALWLGALIILFGVFIGSRFNEQAAPITVALSAVSLAAYLYFSPVP